MNVFFFGDSICSGQFVSPHKIWVTHIARRLAELSDDIIVMNASISGDTTRMALERMPFDVQSHGVGVILIQFGINDCHLWQTDKGLPRVSGKAFEGNLLEIISRSRTFGAREILVNTNHPTNRVISLEYGDIEHQQGNKEYNEIIRGVARDKEGVQLIDIESGFFKEIEWGIRLEDLLLLDGVHLGVRGHELYFRIVCPFVEEAVKRLLDC